MKRQGITTLPTTYDEYLDAATKVFDAGLPLFGNTMSQTGPNDSAGWAYSLLWSYGGSEVDESGKVSINSDATRAALEYMKALADVSSPGITAFDEGGNNRAFLSGEISATQNATSIFWAAQSQAPEIWQNMNHMTYMAGPNGRQQLIEMNLLSVFDHSQNVDASKDFVRWLMQEEQLGPLVSVGITFYSPLLRHYDDQPNMPWNIEPKFAPLGGQAEGGHLAGWPATPSREAAEAYENQTLVNMFASVVSGDSSIDEAMSRAEGELVSVYG